MTKKRVVVFAIVLVALLPLLLAGPSLARGAADGAGSGETLANLLAGYSWNGAGQGKLTEASEEEVSRIQALLQSLGYDCGGVDGIAGPNTERAVSTFLADRGAFRPLANGSRISGQVELRINIPEYTLSLVERGKVTRQFDIAVGTPYEQTPTGSFAIFSKVENPTWFPGSGFTDKTPVPPGPDNPLGTRWMEFAPNYGIHGTNKDWDIRYPVSGGCVRMHDEEARELYRLVEIGTPVVVVYETMRLIEKKDGLYLKLFPDIYRKNTSSREQLRLLCEPYLAAGYRLLADGPYIPKEVDEVYEAKIAVRPASSMTVQDKAAAQRRQD